VTDASTALTEAAVSIWLDDLSRERLTSGSLATLASEQQVSGVTTNPSIFAQAITGSDAYAAQLHGLAVQGPDMGEALRELTTFDVRWACNLLRPVCAATDGVDGKVSIGVIGGWRTTPRRRSARPARCGGPLIDRTCSSRSSRLVKPCRRLRRARLSLDRAFRSPRVLMSTRSKWSSGAFARIAVPVWRFRGS
jgi:hypothetical protein